MFVSSDIKYFEKNNSLIYLQSTYDGSIKINEINSSLE
jgi:hypothetical protein